ncbi:MAG: hypothetical protein RI947_1406, partial [Candidatus Parcubacteria bacterium]
AEPHPDFIAAARESFLPEIDRAIELCRQDKRMTLLREWEIATKRDALIAIVREMQSTFKWALSMNEQIEFWTLCKDHDRAADLRQTQEPIFAFAAKLEELRAIL